MKEPTIDNKKLLVNDILNEQSAIINKEPKVNNNLEEPRINKEIKINKKKSTYVKTPEFLRSKRVILNSQNNDNKSFQY